MNPIRMAMRGSEQVQSWQRQFGSYGLRPAAVLAFSLMLCGFVGQQPAMALSPQSRDAYTEARQAERAGNLEAAEQAIRRAVAMDPTDYLNYVKLAAVLNQQGKANEAVSFYRQALLLNPQDTMILYSLGAIEEQLGHYDKAEEDYRLSLQNNPRYRFGLLNLARTEIQQKKYDPAIAHYREFLSSYPDHYEARRHLARLYLVTGKNADAVAQYDFLKRRFPDRFGEHLDLARALNGVNAPQKALEELRIAYAKEGGKADINEEMGRAHASLGQTDLAVHHYRKAYALNPEKDELLLKIAELNRNAKKTTQAIEGYQAFLKRHPDDASVRWLLADAYLETDAYEPALNEMALLLPVTTHPERHYRIRKDMAYATQMLGDMPKAITLYEALQADPLAIQDLQLKSNLAIAYHRTGDYAHAIPLYREIDQADPRQQELYRIDRTTLSSDLTNALTSVGDAAYKKGDYIAALNAYEEAVQHAEPKNHWPYLGLGNAAYALKMSEKAYQAYGVALERDPGNVTARLYRTRLSMEIRESADKNNPTTPPIPQPEEMETLERLAREHPDNAEVLTTLANVYEQQGNTTAAISAYEKALALTPSNTELMTAIGSLWQKLGHFEQARDMYLKVLTVDNQQASVYYNLGIVYNELGQLAQSEAAYRQALALDPTQADSRYGLAITQEKQQKYQDALETYQFYINDPQARYREAALSRIQLLQQAVSAGRTGDVAPQNQKANGKSPESKAPEKTVNKALQKNNAPAGGAPALLPLIGEPKKNGAVTPSSPPPRKKSADSSTEHRSRVY